jgi:hypothetical protein
MPIAGFSSGPSRRKIGFVRKAAPLDASAALEARGYECFLVDEDRLDTEILSTTDSLVICQVPDKPSHFAQDLTRCSGVLNHDCRIYIRYAPDLASEGLVLDWLNRLKLPPSGIDAEAAGRFSSDWFDAAIPRFGPFVHILRADDDWASLANIVANNPAGQPPSTTLDIDQRRSGEGERWSGERALLLRRAFWDCSSIDLFRKTDGMSGVDAFEAFAHLAGNVVGTPEPFRCFVKIGPRTKVAREFEKYRATALENVPYHLGPRLRLDRCVLGKSQGLITCDYVGGAETLRDCVRDGRAVHVIANLFNQTLISWRRAAREEKPPLQRYLAEHLHERRIVPEHRQHLIRDFGATKTLAELKGLIDAAQPSAPVVVGVIHGDLHATNVLVRMNDAIIIDLERIATDQPILLDAASLEGGLLVDGFVGDKRSGKEVLESLLPLYTPQALRENDHSCHPSSKSTWFFDSVRQIRMQASQMERQPYQYGWTLGAVLLKKACNPEGLKESGPHDPTRLTREQVRAIAFLVGESIVLGLSKAEDAGRV